MVDLVKIRKKKAEQKAEGRKQKAEVSVLEETADGRLQTGGATAPQPEAAPPAEPPPTTDHRPPATPLASSKLDKFKEQAGQRRDQQAAQQVVEGEAQLELLTFVIAKEQYAVDIEHIVEIVTPRPVTRIPNADLSILGILSLRGTIVTLVDVRRRLRHPAAPRVSPDTRIVVIDRGGELVGFTVDKVLRVVKARPGEIEPHPVVHASEIHDSIRGVFRAANALTILLDLDKLLDSRGLAAVVA